MRIVYTGAFPELLTGQGHTIVRDVPIDLPDPIAQAYLEQDPESFSKVAEA
jgi:hypothetical protein